MSDITVGNFKNKADRDAQIKKLKEYVKLDKKLQSRLGEINKTYYTNLSYGTAQPTSVPVIRSSRAEIEDIIKQKQDALGNLRQIFPYGDDAQSALGYLSTTILPDTDVSEIALFNRHFTEFKKVIGTKNITPSYFNTVWDRFKVRLAKTQNTGLEIQLDHTDLDEQLRQLGNSILHNLQETEGLTQTKLKDVKQAILIAVKDRNEVMLQRLNKAVENGNLSVIEAIARHKAGEGYYSDEYLRGLRKETLRQILADLLGIPNTPENILSHFEVRYMKDVTLDKLIDEIKVLQETGESPMKARREPSTLEGFGGAEAQPPTTPPQTTPSKTPKKKGRPKGRGIMGRGFVGIAPIKDPKFIDFGKYLIHIPSLRMNKLNLKYRSKGYINRAKEISDNLRELLFYVLEHGKIDLDLYNKLTETEKNYFNEISHKAQIETKLGVKYNEEDKRKQIQRFEILRGQVLSGNNAPEVFKELKELLIQFVENGTISYKSGFDLVRDLGMI